jgi:hypothetical protein
MTVRRKGLASTETTENSQVFGPENRKMQQGLRSPGVLVSGHQDICHGQDQCICGRSSRRGKILVMGWVCESLSMTIPQWVYPTFDQGKGKILKNFEWAIMGPKWYDATVQSCPVLEPLVYPLSARCGH